MGCASKFERDLFLDIVRGVVVSTRVRQNGVAESATPLKATRLEP